MVPENHFGCHIPCRILKLRSKKSEMNFMNLVEFKRILDFVREGDFLMVEAFDRLGCDYNEIIRTINYLN